MQIRAVRYLLHSKISVEKTLICRRKIRMFNSASIEVLSLYVILRWFHRPLIFKMCFQKILQFFIPYSVFSMVALQAVFQHKCM